MTDCYIELNLDTPSGVLTMASGDVSALDPWLLDGMEWRWTRGDVSTAGQPEPVECRFTIVSPGPLPVDIGARVSAQLWDAPPPLDDGEVVGFYGRVAEVVASPTSYEVAGSLVEGQEYACVAVDYTVDLAEITANYPAYVADEAGGRVGDYLSAAAVEGAPSGLVNALGLDDWVELKAEEPGAGGALERIAGVLDQVGVADLPADPSALDRRLARRAVFAPRVDPDVAPGDFHSAASWALDAPPSTYSSATPTDFPLVLTSGPDGYELVVDDDSPLVLSAEYIDYAARWKRDKFSHPNRASVTYTPTGSDDEATVNVDADDRATGDPVAQLQLQAALIGDEYAARRMAYVYLPEADARDRWVAESFRYYPPDWTRLQYAPWFPRHHDVDDTPETVPGDPATRAQCYGHPLVISGIDPAHNPTGRSWYAGVLHGVQLTVDGDQPVVEVTLRRVLPIPDGAGALKVSDMPAGVTPADLAPGFTVYDYRLARGA